MHDQEELIRQASNASLPWKSVDCMERDFGGSISLVMKSEVAQRDSQQLIDKCLNCKRQYCTNCLSSKKKWLQSKKMKMVVKQCENQMVMEM